MMSVTIRLYSFLKHFLELAVLILLVHLLKPFLTQPHNYLIRGYAAISDSGVQIVYRIKAVPSGYQAYPLGSEKLSMRISQTAQLALDHFLAFLYVLLAALTLEPLVYLVSCPGCTADLEPVTARTMRIGSEDLNDLTVLEHIVVRHYLSVHLRAAHLISDFGVDRKREIDDGALCRQGYHPALRSEYKHLIREKIKFQRIEKFIRIYYILLSVKQRSYPFEL